MTNLHSGNPVVSFELKNLEVAYEKQVALKCEEARFTGNIHALIGHNGAGKSTFLKTILGLLVPKSGSIVVDFARDGTSHELLKPEESIAYCPESGSVFSDITVRQYVELWCRLKTKDPKYYKNSDGAKVMEYLDIEPLMGKLGRELSKGQRRRVQTAIGFLISPKLFLIDEPFDGLDVERTHRLTSLIKLFSQKMTFVVSSHRMDVMERLADYVIVFYQGRLRASGSVSEVAESLAGSTFVLETDSEHPRLQEQLSSRWPDTVVNSHGGYLTLTGEGLDLDQVRLVASMGPSKIRTVSPTLVDAMTYHLKTSLS
jgi:ABC-type multidrug transport system ATPase subunit